MLGSDFSGDGQLNVNSGAGNTEILLGTLGVRAYEQSGQESTSLGTDDQGGVLWVSNTAGTLVAHPGADVDGGAFRVSKNAGDSMVMVAVESGGGFVSVRG